VRRRIVTPSKVTFGQAAHGRYHPKIASRPSPRSPVPAAASIAGTKDDRERTIIRRNGLNGADAAIAPARSARMGCRSGNNITLDHRQGGPERSSLTCAFQFGTQNMRHDPAEDRPSVLGPTAPDLRAAPAGRSMWSWRQRPPVRTRPPRGARNFDVSQHWSSPPYPACGAARGRRAYQPTRRPMDVEATCQPPGGPLARSPRSLAAPVRCRPTGWPSSRRRSFEESGQFRVDTRAARWEPNVNATPARQLRQTPGEAFAGSRLSPARLMASNSQ
jgi:hypothetical protein